MTYFALVSCCSFEFYYLEVGIGSSHALSITKRIILKSTMQHKDLDFHCVQNLWTQVYKELRLHMKRRSLKPIQALSLGC